LHGLVGVAIVRARVGGERLRFLRAARNNCASATRGRTRASKLPSTRRPGSA
jgi:hypothetical protein